MPRKAIPDPETKALIALSGGLCAFPGCQTRFVAPGRDADPVAFLGVRAHIVGDSRQGPRGASPMSDEERGCHTNLILLCGDHHKLIDSQPRVYSVPVLRRMKEDHETRVRRATAAASPAARPAMVDDTIHSSILAVTHLPAAVFAATCGFRVGQDDQVRSRIRYPNSDSELVRFALHDGKLLTFHNLRDPGGPFRDVIDARTAKRFAARDLWSDAEGQRRYVGLLNRGLFKYAARRGVRFDPAHKRFHFEADAGRPRSESYRPLNARKQTTRLVAWQPKIQATGQGRGFWKHLAAGLSFVKAAPDQWYFSIRIERHLTTDGVAPLPASQIGRRVTREKARMYNDKYLGEVNFWRDYLSGGKPNIVLDFGDQSAVISTQLLAFDIRWPGIPGDLKAFTNTTYESDLFSDDELGRALGDPDSTWEADDEAA